MHNTYTAINIMINASKSYVPYGRPCKVIGVVSNLPLQSVVSLYIFLQDPRCMFLHLFDIVIYQFITLMRAVEDPVMSQC